MMDLKRVVLMPAQRFEIPWQSEGLCRVVHQEADIFARNILVSIFHKTVEWPIDDVPSFRTQLICDVLRCKISKFICAIDNVDERFSSQAFKLPDQIGD
jgi:hypothetical protein